jgi:hypothetical protein
MQWVKASERMPVEGDETSIDTLGDVIRRFEVNGEPGIGCCGWDRLKDSDEWLEGWNVDTRRARSLRGNEKTVA